MTQIIALDFDDVVVDFNAQFCAYHNQRFGTRITYDDITTFDMQFVYGCEDKDIVRRVLEFYDSEHHERVLPMESALEYIELLSRRYTLDVVTSRPESSRTNTLALLHRHFPRTFRAVHFTNGFGAGEIEIPKTKAQLCKEIGAGLIVEDAPRHVKELCAAGIRVIMPDRPWNRTHTPEGAVRLSSWKEIVSWIETHI